MNLEQFFSRLQASISAMSGKQLGTMAVAFLTVVGLTIGSAYYINAPTYGVLFSDMDPSAAGAIVTKLKSAKVDYRLDEGGRTVRVPTSRVDELRVQYSSDGLAGGVSLPGNELFDKMQFGVTDFQERVNYRRALEGELSRTISTIAEVAGARVHIAMPPASLFTGRDQPTTASVILKMRSNRKLSASTVTAITGLVSASVESLKPESVVIIDNFGRPLSRPSEDDSADGAPVERQQRLERDMTSRVIALLEPIVGVGHVRVNVTAKLNNGSQEQTEERFDPTPVLRSAQLTSTTNGTNSPG
ncbi:MAG: flagellar basal-body MS-ring/collar protein FliF, partial [Vicinamibacterales bacterium]